MSFKYPLVGIIVQKIELLHLVGKKTEYLRFRLFSGAYIDSVDEDEISLVSNPTYSRASI